MCEVAVMVNGKVFAHEHRRDVHETYSGGLQTNFHRTENLSSHACKYQYETANVDSLMEVTRSNLVVWDITRCPASLCLQLTDSRIVCCQV